MPVAIDIHCFIDWRASLFLNVLWSHYLYISLYGGDRALRLSINIGQYRGIRNKLCRSDLIWGFVFDHEPDDSKRARTLHTAVRPHGVC